jgi:hypothetical protein
VVKLNGVEMALNESFAFVNLSFLILRISVGCSPTFSYSAELWESITTIWVRGAEEIQKRD